MRESAMLNRHVVAGVDEETLAAINSVIAAAQSLLKASTISGDADACRVATHALSGSIEWVGNRCITIPRKNACAPRNSGTRKPVCSG